MFSRIPFLIPLIAISEIYLIIKVGGTIGLWPTVSIVMITGMTGVILLRQQGFQLLTQLNQKLSSGQSPATELIEGVALMIGGVMLITPGFLTDVSGFSLLLPWTRKLLVRKLAAVFEKQIQAGTARGFYYSRQGGDFRHHQGPGSGFNADARPSNSSANVIDGEFEEVKDAVDGIEEKK